jgi:glycosyltransferase involved in cell wall biosynthesis
MMAGIDHCQGDIIIPMDADLQNDPEDIPRLLAKLDEGYDVCSGWRQDRQDHAIKRNLPSRLANKLISTISGVPLHDYGCSLKAYRRNVIKDVKLYGEMHRFIPIYASWMGARVTEIPVSHHPRLHGESNYGLNRTFKVILDLIVIQFMSRYMQKPIHFFGGFGLINLALSFLTFGWMLSLKLFWDTSFSVTPLPMLIILFFLIGLQSIFFGLLAEIQMRTYYESQDKDAYQIEEKMNFD